MVGKRGVHHVGSMPLDMQTVDETMRLSMDVAGQHLRSLPDGEVGRNYVQPVVDGFRDHPALRQTNTGDWSTMDKRTMYKIRRGHRLDEKPLDDYLLYFRSGVDSWPVFQRMREEYDRPDLSYQVGLPTDFVISFITFGPGGAFQNRKAFLEATWRGIQRVYDIAGDKVIFQLEAPAEGLLTAKAPGLIRPIVARKLAKGMARIAANSPVGARFGIHLCLGSLQDEAQAEVRRAGQFVPVLNSAREQWPTDRTLEFVHLPLLSSRGTDFFRGLGKLDVADTRIAAGLAREERPFDEQRDSLRRIEDEVGHSVDISSVCGLGRRQNSAAAKAALERMVALATS
jgi:hypothetical protein